MSMQNTSAIVLGFAALLPGLAQAATVGFPSAGYSIESIGLTDAEHTADTGARRNRAVLMAGSDFAAGTARRYSGNTARGSSAWRYDGGSSVRIGLIDTEHTRDTDGFQFSNPDYISPSGDVAGYSLRYGAGGADLGRSAWSSNGATTVRIGLVDDAHTADAGNPFGPEGFRQSTVLGLSDTGQVVGESLLYDIGPNTIQQRGTSAWLYNGSTTLNIGLTDATHTQSSGLRDAQVRAMNSSGQVIGDSDRYNGSVRVGQSSWIYDGTSTKIIGLTGAAYTRADGRRYSEMTGLNEAGQVAGESERFDVPGISAWFYDGSSTVRIGLMDDEHTRASGSQISYSTALSESGQVAGYAIRASDVGGGNSAWVYNGADTLKIGLTDAEHTRDDGFVYGQSVLINAGGNVAGYANRYKSGGSLSAQDNGRSAWLYDGATTINVGLTNAEHTREDGRRYSEALAISDGGQVAGLAERYGAGGTDLGQSIWVYNGATTINAGLAAGVHTRDTDGYRYSELVFMNGGGQAAGLSARYGAGDIDLGQDAWFFDGNATQSLGSLSVSSTGYAWSAVQALTDDGLVLGTYRLYDESDDYVDAVFGYSEAAGLFDLGLLVDETFAAWDYLSTAISISDDGVIFGSGKATGVPGVMAYKLTPNVVPIPAAVWLFASALGLLGWTRRSTHKRAA